MEIYMTHPQHGAMHVYSEQDANRNLANGWERAGEPCAEPATVDNQPPQVDKAPAPKLTLAEQYEEKFGRRPDGRWKEARLKRELED